MFGPIYVVVVRKDTIISVLTCLLRRKNSKRKR